MEFLQVIVLGSYAFTAGCYVFTWKCYKELSNHRRTELRDHLQDKCKDECYYCEDE